MSRTSTAREIQAVRRLNEGDDGYVDGEQLFEVEERPVPRPAPLVPPVRTIVINMAEVDARLVQARKRKARVITMSEARLAACDDRIERLVNLKAAIESA